MFFPERRRNHGPWPVGSLAGLPHPHSSLSLSLGPPSLPAAFFPSGDDRGVAPPPPCPTLGPPLPPRPRPSTGRGWSRVGIHIHLYWLVSPSSLQLLQFTPWGLFFVCCEQINLNPLQCSVCAVQVRRPFVCGNQASPV